MKKSFALPHKSEHVQSYDATILLPVIYPSLETPALGNMYMRVYSSIVHNDKKLEAIQVSTRVEYIIIIVYL